MNKKITILVFGLIAFVYFLILFTSQNHVDGDEAVVGIMAKHIMARGEIPVFFYGQPYGGGGAIEAFLAVIPLAVFGVSSIPLKLTALLIWLAVLVFTYIFCFRYFGRSAAFVSTLILATATPLIEWHFKMRGGYAGLLLFSILILYLFARIAYDEKREPLSYLLLGFLGGLAYYNLEMISPLLFVLFLASIYHYRVFWKGGKFLIVFAGLIAGLARLIYYNLAHNFINFKYVFQVGFNDTGAGFLSICLRLLTKYLPAFFTGRNVDQYVRNISVISYVEYFIYLMVFVYTVWYAVIQIKKSFYGHAVTLKLEHILILFIFVQLIVNISSRNIYISPRYFLPLFPALAIILGISFDRLSCNKSRMLRYSGIFLLGFLVGTGFINHLKYIGKSYVNDDILLSNGRIINTPVTGESARAIIDYLKESGISFARCTYFLQWRLIFESNENIIASSAPAVKRYPLYDEQVKNAKKYAFIFHRNDIQLNKFLGFPYYSGYSPGKNIFEYIVFIPK